VSGYSHIPFGLRNIDNNLVDVSEVERGAKCDCICPSCDTPLMARQGEKNEWHFAHQSLKSFEQTRRECDYSYYVSVRLMIKQLVDKNIELLTPELKGVYIDQGDLTNPVTETFMVAEPTLLSVTNAEVEVVFEGHKVDFVFRVGGFSIIVFVCYEGRMFPFGGRKLIGPKCGLLIINLSLMPNLFVIAKREHKPYVELLKEYLATGLEGKEWFYHPRYGAALAQAKARVEESKMLQLNYKLEEKKRTTDYRFTLGKHLNEKRVQYKCVMCGSSWSADSLEERTCERCKTHLYVTTD